MVKFERALNEGKALTVGIIDTYVEQIQTAFDKSGGAMSISLGIKFVPETGGDLKVEASINFVESSVKEKVTNVLSNQSEIEF